MSQQTVIGALNRLLAHQCYSLLNYLSEAPPWTHPGNEELVEATRSIADDHEHYAQRLADAIEDRRGVFEAGRYATGAIEDYDVNCFAVNVLEGTYAAFDNRRRKWQKPV